MIAKSKIKLKDPEYQYLEDTGGDGAFILPDSKHGVDQIYTCREELSGFWNDEDILFAFDKLNIKGLNETLEYAEKRLKLPKKQKCVIHLTNYDNIVFIKVSDFWLENALKRDVLSLLIRCGAVYNTNGIKKAFNSYKLTKQCLPALNLFLSGYTKLNFSMSPLIKEIVDDNIGNPQTDFDECFSGFVDWTRYVGFKNLKDGYLIKE